VRIILSDGSIVPAPRVEGWFDVYVRQCLEDIKKESPDYRIPKLEAEGRLGSELLDR